MWSFWIYEHHICELRSEEWNEGWSSPLYTQLLKLRKESLKKDFCLIFLDREIQSFYHSFMEDTIEGTKRWKPQTWVYLNCCSTSLMTVWQSRQINVPVTNSGCTGCVRTTCPLILNRVPIFWLVSSRILKDHTHTQKNKINNSCMEWVFFSSNCMNTSYLCLVGRSVKLT